jgi:tetratricopeptide (TPR) repeat protein
MKTHHDLIKWQVLALAIGLYPASRLGAEELSVGFSAARVLYEERRYAEARTLFGALGRDQPDSVELNFYLGRLALWFDDEVDALAHLEKAARLLPDDARVQNALGDACGLAAQKAGLLAKLGWARKCLNAYRRAAELAPAVPAYRWSLLGFYCVAPRIAGGGRDEAEAQAREIAKLDPMGGRVARATLFLAANKPTEAFAQFDEVLRETPDDFTALYHVGRCAALSGLQLDRGLAALERCLRLLPPHGEGMPTLANVHHRLGEILARRGDRSGAEVHAAAARRVHPDFRAEKDALRN